MQYFYRCLYPFFENDGALSAYMNIQKPSLYLFFDHKGEFTLGGISFCVSPECFGTGKMIFLYEYDEL